MVISGCFVAVLMSKMDPKRPKSDIICTKVVFLYNLSICLLICNPMTLLGLWRANLGPKLTPKGQIWHDFAIICNFLHMFSINHTNTLKFLCSPLIRPQWSFLGVLWPYYCPKWTPKGPNLTLFVPRYSLFIQFVYLSPKDIYMGFFTLVEASWSFLDIFWL